MPFRPAQLTVVFRLYVLVVLFFFLNFFDLLLIIGINVIIINLNITKCISPER